MNETIEILKKEDIKLYKTLIDECFGGSNDISFYENYEKNNNYKIFVFKKDNKIIGSITAYKIDLFTYSFQPAIEIFNVCVLKEYRKNNIAKALFDKVIDYAKQENCKSMFLTCLDTAIAAHKLYESVGFKRMTSIKYSMNI